MQQNERANQREEQERLIKSSLLKIGRKILVMSGKGGVGKSSVSVSLAAGLAARGYKTGIMDVDIHGPSIPQMLGMGSSDRESLNRKRSVRYENNRIIPAVYSENLSAVSIEFLLEKTDSAVIWRGPMKIGAIRQFVSDVEWGLLDFLIIDSPPGTGDEPLSVVQTIPDAEALIVTTPQELSLRDVRKSINFCRKLNTPILGLVENMSGFICPGCGLKTDLFKSGGGKKASQEMELYFLGSIPIIPEIVSSGDDGKPAILFSKPLQEAFETIFDKVIKNRESEDVKESDNQKENIMKIAIPVTDGKLAAHFGHCREFMLISADKEKKEITESVSEEPPPHEPGVLPKWLHEKGAEIIIAGGMGSRAQDLFEHNGIKVVTGAVSEDPVKLVKDYLEGRLVTGGNVCSH